MHLPTIREQLEEYAAALARGDVAVEPLRQVDTRLARRLKVPFEQLKALVASGEIPAAKQGRGGGLYVTTSAVDRWLDSRGHV